METIINLNDQIINKAKEIIRFALGENNKICKQLEGDIIFLECIKSKLSQLDKKRTRVEACNLLIENYGHPYESWVYSSNNKEIEDIRNRLVLVASEHNTEIMNEYCNDINNKRKNVINAIKDSTLAYTIVIICMYGWISNEVSTVLTIENIAQVLTYLKTKELKLYKLIDKLLLYSEFPFRSNEEYGRYFLRFPDSDSEEEREKAVFLMLFWELHGTMRLRYARECDRIRSSVFFRYLQYKAQVMFNCASDEQRTRLSHSLAVSDTAKTIAKQLGCNWELAEAIGIGHDLGHVAFGHQGEEKLDECLHRVWAGRFIHSLQSVKILNDLTRHSVIDGKFGISGLCLSRPVLEGVLKHDSDCLLQDITRASWCLQYNGWREALIQYDENCMVTLDEGVTGLSIGNLESQIVYWSDKISYAGHDWEELTNSAIIDEIVMEIIDILKRMHQLRHIVGGRDGFTRTVVTYNDIIDEITLIRYIRYQTEMIRNCFALPETYMYNPENLEFEKDVLNQKIDIMEINRDKRYEALNPFIKSHLSCFVNEYEKFFKEKINTIKPLKYFTEREYKLLLDFFTVVNNWIKITGIYPKAYKKSDDFIWIFHQYLKEIDNRIIVQKFTRDIIRNSIQNIKNFKSEKEVRDFGLKIMTDRMNETINGCNSLLRIREYISGEGYSFHAKDKNKPVKKMFKKWMHKKMLVTLSDDILEAFENVDDFKKNYYIGSARVRIMKVKAHKIIEKLFTFFMEHKDMLPIEYQQRIEFDAQKLFTMNMSKKMTKDNRFNNIVYQYLYERVQEFDRLYAGSNYFCDKFETLIRDLELRNNPRKNTNDPKLDFDSAVDEFISNYKKNEDEAHINLCTHIAKARVIADYIASMTDRMAEKKYNEIVSSSTAWSTSYHE